MLDIGI